MDKRKQFTGKLPTNCLSVFSHFVGLALKGLNYFYFILSSSHFSDKNTQNLPSQVPRWDIHKSNKTNIEIKVSVCPYR